MQTGHTTRPVTYVSVKVAGTGKESVRLLGSGTQSPTPSRSMSRNPVDRLEAEVGSPKRGPHGHALSHFNWEQ
ncbi:hypothetical protein WJX79_010287 [Trebouxia sp. C0005]